MSDCGSADSDSSSSADKELTEADLQIREEAGIDIPALQHACIYGHTGAEQRRAQLAEA